MADVWNPNQYDRFRAEREAPFRDLVAGIDRDGWRPERVLDLGCGTGRLTAELHRGLGAGSTLGIDSSAAMLEEARELGEPGLSFRAGDIATFAPDESFDLVLSNAALHWIDDHPALLARLASWLTPGGRLAVQVPANFDHPAHGVAARLAESEPFAAQLAGWRPSRPVLAPEQYARTLHELGFEAPCVRLQVYPHVLDDQAALVEWLKGTSLTTYRRQLGEELYAQFVERYRAMMLEDAPEGPVFFPFKRILFWARRST